MSRLLILILLFFVTACSSNLVQLQKIKPTGNEYQNLLAQQYLEFAEAEADQYDWSDSSYFATKGLKSAKGENVEPENLRYRNINDEYLPILEQAKEYLLSTLDDKMKAKHPKEAAKAQFFFDCWVEQQEEGWQDSHITYCREKFYTTLDNLYELAEIDKNGGKADDSDFADLSEELLSKKEQNEIKRSKDGASEKHKLYFDFDSSVITDKTRQKINKVTKRLQDVGAYEITLNGYADRAGDEDYNMELSKKRAEAVKKELVSKGISEKSITIFAFGEVHGLVETPDNVREKENRVVQVVLEM
jgi:OOP family OmpA-OmpF porin